MKLSRRYLIVGFIALCAVMVSSCSSRKPSYNRENLKAIWIQDTFDGTLSDPSDWTVFTFGATGAVVLNGVITDTEGNRKWGNDDLFFDAYCCSVTLYGEVVGLKGITESRSINQQYDFLTSEDSLVTLTLVVNKVNEQEVPAEYTYMTMRKIPALSTKTDSLAGVWQFATRDGATLENFRLEFHPDGKMIFYTRDFNGVWVPTGSGEDFYNVYSDFLAITIFDNLYFGTSSKWDVACMSDMFASPFNSYMTFTYMGHVYTLTYVSSIN